MALRPLKILLAVVALTVLAVVPAAACFGPKLYVGVAADPRQELLFALVSLYVVEKTGVESERVVLAADMAPGTELQAERVDLVFASTPVPGGEKLLAIPGYPLLVSGPRPLHDLQFTTVVPALRKLATLLTPGDLLEMETRIAAGDKPLAAARRLCMERRWL